jgi:hypothetical protein
MANDGQLRAEQALAADSPVSGLCSKLRGRAAEAQRWAAIKVESELVIIRHTVKVELTW